MVPRRNTTPSTIRTKGPASERRRCGGRGGSGENAGVVTGLGVTGFGGNWLDIFHLARRGWLRALHRGRWRSVGRKSRCPRRQGAIVPVGRSVALHQLD